MSSSNTFPSHAPRRTSSSSTSPSSTKPASNKGYAPDGGVSPGDTSAVFFEDDFQGENDQGIGALPSGQQLRRSFTSDRRLSAATQQALFQAYFHALRTGQMPRPNMSPAAAKAEHQANHHRTISDAKKGVTYAGQELLKQLPIPDLHETCQRYLDSVKPFLVDFHVEYAAVDLLDSSRVYGNEECGAGLPGARWSGVTEEADPVCLRQDKLYRTILYSTSSIFY